MWRACMHYMIYTIQYGALSIIHSKLQFLSLFTQHNVISNLYVFFFFKTLKKIVARFKYRRKETGSALAETRKILFYEINKLCATALTFKNNLEINLEALVSRTAVFSSISQAFSRSTSCSVEVSFNHLLPNHWKETQVFILCTWPT